MPHAHRTRLVLDNIADRSGSHTISSAIEIAIFSASKKKIEGNRVYYVLSSHVLQSNREGLIVGRRSPVATIGESITILVDCTGNQANLLQFSQGCIDLRDMDRGKRLLFVIDLRKV
jgi:hypothetical protein